jgi:hypothetical protein
LWASDEETRVEASDDGVGFCTEHVTIVILRTAGIAPKVGATTNGEEKRGQLYLRGPSESGSDRQEVNDTKAILETPLINPP